MTILAPGEAPSAPLPRLRAALSRIAADRATNDRALAGVGAIIGIAAFAWLLHRLIGAGHGPLLIAPVGAAAVLVFAVPASPLAQPWALFGGNVLSALVGVTVARLGLDPWWAAGLAVGGAICAMALLRCLHPPGGAVALTAVLGGPAVAASGYGFVAMPVAVGTAMLFLTAWCYHRFSGHSYPHVAPAAPVVVHSPLEFGREDLLGAIDDYPDILDVNIDDLERLLHAAEQRALNRRRGTR
ncbi:HPP family protein [Rhizorhabdus sp.]|uniref:HPP family protein n=1 Tax=Rhizorhabdus sp. TaxID=1968843 RepID=UPI0035B2FBA5